LREDKANGDYETKVKRQREEGKFILDNSILLESQDRLNHSDENTKLIIAEMEYKRRMAYYANNQYE
jgi:hypothetical protein